jgi:hypothetical protein
MYAVIMSVMILKIPIKIMGGRKMKQARIITNATLNETNDGTYNPISFNPCD